MRGLKQKSDVTLVKGKEVASFTDAWIETGLCEHVGFGNKVASFTDAWIETIMLRYQLQIQ